VPCYLFTYHAYGSWMPDHPRGYVRRGQGILPPDSEMADFYRGNLTQDLLQFDEAIQQSLIEATLEASQYQEVVCHFIATEVTHAHLLLSWKTNRTWQVARAKMRESLSRRLNRDFKKRLWFSKSPSRRQVKEQEHFDYLVRTYLPKHSGWKWSPAKGMYR